MALLKKEGASGWAACAEPIGAEETFIMSNVFSDTSAPNLIGPWYFADRAHRIGRTAVVVDYVRAGGRANLPERWLAR